jgi:hypothetical protein
MTQASFSKLTSKKQIEYLKKSAILIHKIMKGNLIVSLYWSKEFIFEVLTPKNKFNSIEIKCYDRFKYIES